MAESLCSPSDQRAGSTFHDIRVHLDGDPRPTPITKFPMLHHGEAYCAPMATIILFLVSTRRRWTRRSFSSACRKAVSSAIASCADRLPGEICHRKQASEMPLIFNALSNGAYVSS